MRTLRTSSSGSHRGGPERNPPRPPSRRRNNRRRQPPTFRTGSNLVRVDVYPTRDGQPVVDLAATDFEISEDGVPQKVATFEHVVVRPAGPQSERVEPGSQRDMLQAAANPRNRVFVIFLDAPNVSVSGSHDIAEPIIRLINRILGPDDLVGIMTPDMSASDVVLSRRTEVTEEQLRKHWTWGGRFSLLKDDREQAYLECYPPLPNERAAESAMARALIDRKRERATLEALQDLVRYLNGIREERKAILTVTEGWLLFRPDPSLEKLRSDPATGAQDPIPGVDPVGVGPNGKLTTKDPRRTNPALSRMECDADRQRLAAMDDDSFFRDIIDDANRGECELLRGRSTRAGGLRHADQPGPVGGPGCPIAEDPAGGDADAGRGDGRPGGDGQQRSGQGAAPDLGRPHVVLPARLLLDQHQAGWRLPLVEGARHPTGSGGAGASRLSRRQRGGGRKGPRRGGGSGRRGREPGERGDRQPRQHPPGSPDPSSRHRLAGHERGLGHG